MSIEEIEFELEMAGINRDEKIKLLSSIRRISFYAKALER